jgi:hypothetical protein
MGQRGQRGHDTDSIKKDRQSVANVRREIEEEIRGGTAAGVHVRDPNRDTARGDWDRTNRRFDEGVSRDDEMMTQEPRPDELYPKRDEQ